MKYLLFILSIILLVSCRCNEKIIYQSYTETVRDTVFTFAPDSSHISLLLECDSANNVLIKEILSYDFGREIEPPKIVIHENILTTICRTDTVYFTLPIKETIKGEIKIIDNTKHRLFEDLFYYSGIILLVALLLFILFKLFI